MKKNLFYFLTLGSVLILSGCVARTYTLTRDRVDQDLTGGNRGFLTGKSPAEEALTPRKTERTVRVFEVEMGKPYQPRQVNAPLAPQQQETSFTAESPIQETGLETPSAETESGGAGGQSQRYTVEKNDTLQKISKKFYGTSKKWMKIYNANRDVLKGPDKVYPGQVLGIPDAGETKPAAEHLLKEPKENLK